VRASGLPALVDDAPGAVAFDLQAPNGEKYDSKSVQIRPTDDMRPELAFGHAILGYDVAAKQCGRYRLKVTPTDGDPVLAAILVAEPGTPTPS
jgi:hypothetical protein